MTPLNLPPYEISVRQSGDKRMIFDVLRRKYVALTPEEWVRQHFIHYLIDHKHYPAALLANEVELHVGNKTLRADSVLYDRQLHPRMIMEYKAPGVSISQKTFDQIGIYNQLMKVDYLIVSNGMNHYACKMDYEHRSYLFLEDIPDYTTI